MTATEIENFQEAFVSAHAFSIEMSLAIVLVLVAFVALFWLFSIPQDR